MGTAKTNRRKQKAQQREAKAAKKGQQRNLILAILIGVVGFVLYTNTLSHGYVLDDFSVIEKNNIIRQGFSAIPTIFKTSYRAGYEAGHNSLFRPLSLVMFAMEWGISPNNPGFHHFVNILLYGLGGGVLFLTLIRLFGNRNVMIAFIAAMLFIAHPLHTEVVANIKSRDEILLLLFGALALNRFLRYMDTGQLKQLLYSVGWYFLAILSKESAITFLALFPLALYFFRDHSLKKILQSSAVFLGPALIYLFWRTAVLGDLTGHSKVARIDNLLMFAQNDWLTQKATAVMIIGKYLLLLIFPHPLVNDASYNQIPLAGLNNPYFWLSFLVLVGLAIYGIRGLKKKDPVAFGIAFFFITFSIYSNLIITIGSSYGERFLFIPILGFTIAVAFLLARFLKFDREDHQQQSLSALLGEHKPGLAILAVVVLLFGYKTIDRNPDWESELTLYSADVVHSPNSARMRYYYGMVLMKDLGVKATVPAEKNRYFDQAISEFEQAVAIYPVYADA
ncbi:MAG: glycosyltransferase family 39 protein [Salibacteraceae bacterium]